MNPQAPFNEEKASNALREIAKGLVPHAFAGMSYALPDEPDDLDRWASEDPNFAARYEAAKRLGADAMVAYCVSIADSPAYKADMKKVMIDARMKLAAIWAPDKYSPKVINEHTGKNGGPLSVIHRPFKSLTATEQADLEKRFGL